MAPSAIHSAVWRWPSLERPVVAHLRRDARLLGDPGHGATLPDVAGQRLLAVDVLAGLHGQDRDVGVEMVRSGDEDGVDLLLLLQHHAEVLVDGALVVGSLRGVVLLDLCPYRAPAGLAPVVVGAQVPLLAGVGEGDHLAVGFLEERAQVGAPLAAHADDRDVDLVARGHETRTPEDVPGEDRGGGDGRRGGGDELTTAGFWCLLSSHGGPLCREPSSRSGEFAPDSCRRRGPCHARG